MSVIINGNNSIPEIYRKANPLLYTFKNDNTVILPYWLVVADFVVYDILLRIWNKIFYGTFLTASEVVTERYHDQNPSPPKPTINPHSTTKLFLPIPVVYVALDYKKLKTEITKKPKEIKFDLSDIYKILTLLGHLAWYCQIQSSCISRENTTVWNCYNLFGYRLYNYIFSSYAKLLNNYIPKLYLHFANKDNETTEVEAKEKRQNILHMLSHIIHYIGIYASTFTIIFVGGSVVPYLFTNVVPMIFTYMFMIVIYIGAFRIILFVIKCFIFIIEVGSYAQESKFASSLLDGLRKGQTIIFNYGIRLCPSMISIMYNLSQYLYYGEDYYQAIFNEYKSRDIPSYFESVRNETRLIAHVVLDIF